MSWRCMSLPLVVTVRPRELGIYFIASFRTVSQLVTANATCCERHMGALGAALKAWGGPSM